MWYKGKTEKPKLIERLFYLKSALYNNDCIISEDIIS